MKTVWIPITARAARLAMFRGLFKAAHHKYIKRVPIQGKFTKRGTPRYRYFYKLTGAKGGHGLDNPEHLKQGAGFAGADGGVKGHYHVEEVHDGGYLTVRHDETGKVERLHKDELLARLHQHHAENIAAEHATNASEREAKRKRSLAELAEARKTGTAKQVEAAKKRAQGLGASEEDLLSEDERRQRQEAAEASARKRRKPKVDVPRGTTQGSGEEVRDGGEGSEGSGGDGGRVSRRKRRDAGGDRQGAQGDRGSQEGGTRGRVPGEVQGVGGEVQGVGGEEAKPDPLGVEPAPGDGKAWTPPSSPAIQKHAEYLPDVSTHEQLVPDELRVFPHPDKERGITQAHQHQADGAVRALAAFDVRDGFLLQDDAGLGKTVTACLTLAALIKRDGLGRRLIVVPAANKESLHKQWAEDGAMVGLDVKRGMPGSPSEKGIWLVSYDELQSTMQSEKGTKVKSGNLHPDIASGFDTVCFDEAHNMKNCSPLVAAKPSSAAQAAVELAKRSSKVLYMSATPFTDVKDLRYLGKLDLFEDSEDGFARFAEHAGASVRRDAKGKITKIINPGSTVPMSTVAATLHGKGIGIKRITDMTGLSTNLTKVVAFSENNEIDKHHEAYPEHTVSKSDVDNTHQIAFDIFRKAAEHGVLSGATVNMWKTQWSKAYWETAKIGHAIAIAEEKLSRDPNAHIAFFSSYKDAARHSHLHRLITKAGDKIEREMGKEKPDMARVAKLMQFEQMATAAMERMPKPKNPVTEIAAYFAKKYGADQVAHVYGNDTKGRTAKGEQQAYQAGKKRILVATMAKGGTGLSFHDTNGSRPRTQINLSLPWSATGFVQVAGRSHRLGSKSNTEMHWLTGDSEHELRSATTVAARARTMGSLVTGDPDMIKMPTEAELARFEGNATATEDDAERELKEAEESEDGDDVATGGDADEAQQTRDHHLQALQEIARGQDALGMRREERLAKQAKEVERDVRRFAGDLQYPLNIGVHPAGAGSYVVHSLGAPRRKGDKAKQQKAIDFLEANGVTKDHRGWFRVEGPTLVRMAEHLKMFDKKAAPADAEHSFRAPGHIPVLQEAHPDATFAQLAKVHDLHVATRTVPVLAAGKLKVAGEFGHRAINEHAERKLNATGDSYSSRSESLDHHRDRLEEIARHQADYGTPQTSSSASSTNATRESMENHAAKRGLSATGISRGRVAITGDTFKHKEELKRVGARWDPDMRAWTFSSEEAAERALARMYKAQTSHPTLEKALRSFSCIAIKRLRAKAH